MSLVPEEEKEAHGTFQSIGVCKELREAISTLGFTKPTRIQAMAIPEALKGKDVIGISQTGSGKTASYAIPILQKLLEKKGSNHLKGLVLCPTRELAKQVADAFSKLGATIGVKVLAIVGGEGMAEQAIQLSKKPHVVVSTPGRIKDHLENTKGFNLHKLEFLVLDEADKMLEYDYEVELMAILELVPKQRVTALYSATMTTKVEKLQKASLRDPVRIEVSSKNSTVETLTQQYLFIPFHQKTVYLVHVLNVLANSVNSILVFCEACHLVRRLTLMLRKMGHRALPLYGAMSQDKREMSLGRFKDGKAKILVGTDVASRGLDIDHVDCVINFSLPTSVKDYIHRVGRTARAGRSGLAINFVSQYDVLQIQKIEEMIGLKMGEFPHNDKEVALLHDRVADADRAALAACRDKEKEIKECQKKQKAAKDKDKADSSGSGQLLKRKRAENEAKFGTNVKKMKGRK